MLVLERKGDEVFCQGVKLTIVKQETKGPGKEVVKVEGLEGSNGQKWVSLSKLNEGMNEIECKAREIVSHQKYVLTEEEREEVNKLQSRINEIIEIAKSRYIKKPNLDIDPSKMTEEERLAKIEEIRKYYGI